SVGKRLDFKVRDLLITQLPSIGGVADCDCQSGCASSGSHPVHTDFCGCPDRLQGDPPDLRQLQGMLRYAAAIQATSVIERQMQPLNLREMEQLEATLASALDAVRSQKKLLVPKSK